MTDRNSFLSTIPIYFIFNFFTILSQACGLYVYTIYIVASWIEWEDCCE
jgi:hypothetical protein